MGKAQRHQADPPWKPEPLGASASYQGAGMIDLHTNGVVRRYLLSGKYAEQEVILEFERSEIVAAIDCETGQELDPAEIGQEDYEFAIDSLIQKAMI
jgi:hypothetical protein